MRTAGDGWLAAERAGRRTRWRLTPAARAAAHRGHRADLRLPGRAPDVGRPLAAGAGPRPGDRPPRPAPAAHPADLGRSSAAPRPGVWISRHPEPGRRGGVGVLPGRGLAAAPRCSSPSTPAGATWPRWSGQAWDLAGIEAGYQEFLAGFAAAAGDPLARLVELVHAWRRFPAVDPALPTATAAAALERDPAAAALFAPAARGLVRGRRRRLDPPRHLTRPTATLASTATTAAATSTPPHRHAHRRPPPPRRNPPARAGAGPGGVGGGPLGAAAGRRARERCGRRPLGRRLRA